MTSNTAGLSALQNMGPSVPYIIGLIFGAIALGLIFYWFWIRWYRSEAWIIDHIGPDALLGLDIDPCTPGLDKRILEFYDGKSN